MNSAAAPYRRNACALSGIALGLIAVFPLFWIAVPEFSFAHFVSLAFLLCLGSLVLALASFWRREQPVLSLCALSYGLTPLFMHLWLGIMRGALPALVFTAALLAVALLRKLQRGA